ncbi:MAG: phosphatase PAP2 family protein [Gemmatimonadaceae bacterium]
MKDVPRTIGQGKPVGRLGRLRHFIADRLDPKAYLGLRLTVALAIGTLGVWAFSALLDAVLDNALLVRLDIAADAAIHARVTPAGLEIFNLVSRIGSPVSMVAMATVIAIVLWKQKRTTMLVGWIAAFGGGGILEHVLKLLVGRTRPVYGAAYLSGHSYSFPSGHAMMSFIGMTTLLFVLWVYWHPSRPARIASIVAAIVVIVLVGVSRIYLGVHYPSDVLGGWAAGAAWVAVCVSGVAFTLHYRHQR